MLASSAFILLCLPPELTRMTTGVKLGHMKNALFGVLTIVMYTTPKSSFFI